MLVSIITICHNPGSQILSAVESVLSQSHCDLEYIIIDGNSTDGTVERLSAMESRNSNIDLVSEPDDGLYDALNKGVRMTKGDIIGFVHADDLLANENILSKVVKAFEVDDLDGVYGDLVYVDREETNKVIRYWRSGQFRRSALKRGWMPPHPALFLRREVYEAVKLSNGEFFDTSFRIAADYDFMLRVLTREDVKLAYIPEVLVKMRVGGESNKSVRNIIRKSREDLRAMKRNGVGGVGTLFCKNVRKIKQFYRRY